MSDVLRMTDGAGEPKLDGCWWFAKAQDTGVEIAIENPHMEADGDEDGIWYAPAFDSLRILDNGEWREPTDEEGDEYTDDVHEFLRHAEWS